MKIEPKYMPGTEIILFGGARRRIIRVAFDEMGSIEYNVWDYERSYDWILPQQIAHSIGEQEKIGFTIEI